jgi:hypothetical protein
MRRRIIGISSHLCLRLQIAWRRWLVEGEPLLEAQLWKRKNKLTCRIKTVVTVTFIGRRATGRRQEKHGKNTGKIRYGCVLGVNRKKEALAGTGYPASA